MFLLKRFGGRANDRFITKSQGFTIFFNPNDEVMDDRGFTIGEEVFNLHVWLLYFCKVESCLVRKKSNVVE